MGKAGHALTLLRTSHAMVEVRAAARTDVGLVRSNNEDAYLAVELAEGKPLGSARLGPAGILFGACDGMGGAAAGEVASRLAVESILRDMLKASRTLDPRALEQALRRSVVQAGKAIRANVRAHPDRAGMGTTATIAAVRGSLLVLAQVGDSRAYLLRAGELRQLTTDQSWAQELVAGGLVDARDVERLERANFILQAVGRTEKLEVAAQSLALQRGDRILVCSDGLSGMVEHDQIRQVLVSTADVDRACDELIRAAKLAGGRDNITVVLCDFDGEGLVDATGEDGPATVATVARFQRGLQRGLARRVACLGLLLLALASGAWYAGTRPHAGATAARGTMVARAASAAPSRDAKTRRPDRSSSPAGLTTPAAEPLSTTSAAVAEAAGMRSTDAITARGRRGMAEKARAKPRVEQDPEPPVAVSDPEPGSMNPTF
jgi:serine/threonine protein phosphatase PrpC